MTNGTPAQKANFIDALAQYFTPRQLGIFVLGIASGAPLALTLATLTLWLAREGIEKSTIGVFALTGLPYTFKFLWAPLLDAVKLPLLSRLIGQRRSWMIVTQILLAVAIFALGGSDPARQIMVTAGLTLSVAFLSATQDVLIDAYRIEILRDDEQGTGAAMIQFGYRVGLLIAGAGALVMADLIGFPATYAWLALIPLMGGAAALLWKEPGRHEAPAPGHFLRDSVLAPLADFLTRPGALWILLFIVLFKVGDALANLMLGPLFVELDFTNTELAFANKVIGFGAFFLGAWIGGLLYASAGLYRSLMISGIAMAATNFVFAWLSTRGHDVTALGLSIFVESVASGIGGTVVIAWLSSLCNVRFTATQYALLSSIAVIGRTVVSSSSGFLAEAMGWQLYFGFTALTAIPALALLLWLGKDRLGVEN